MKTYENESLFVNSFAKDAKESIRVSGQFEAAINGCNIVVSGMDNNNSSKVTIYSCTVDGVEFSGSITALKKKLNITYTKEYKRSAEGTKVSIKTDDELSKTAETAAKRISDAINVIKQAASKYRLSRAEMFERAESVEALILDSLKKQRDKVTKEREEREAKQAAEAAKREAKKQQLLEALSSAAAKGNYEEITRLTKELKSYM